VNVTPIEQLRSSTGEVDRACGLLAAADPEALDGCSAVLAAAARGIEALQPDLRGLAADPEALAEAWRLQRSVRCAGTLLANAAAYHREWQGLVAVRTAGYGPGGRPGEPPRTGSLCVRG
jgi:hypothetical protein